MKAITLTTLGAVAGMVLASTAEAQLRAYSSDGTSIPISPSLEPGDAAVLVGGSTPFLIPLPESGQMILPGTETTVLIADGGTTFMQGVQSMDALSDLAELDGSLVAFDNSDIRHVPPIATGNADPDSLYRAARQALNRGNYTEAVRLFAQLRTEYPDSEYAADTFYWQAYAFYRSGGTREMRQAVALLDQQAELYDDAATLREARALRTRISGRLASQGDLSASIALYERLLDQQRSQLVQGEGQVTREELEALQNQIAVQQSRLAEARAHQEQQARSLIHGLSDECGTDEWQVKMEALRALVNLDEDIARPILISTLDLRGECTEQMRRHAVLLLSQHRGEASAAALAESARNDPSPRVREAAITSLMSTRSSQAIPLLMETVRNESDPRVRQRALMVLGQYDSEATRTILMEIARDPDEDRTMRERAIMSIIYNRNSRPSTSELRALYGTLEYDVLRGHVLQAIAENGSDEDLAWILQQARDTNLDEGLRRRALVIGMQSNSIDLDTMVDLYTSLDSRDSRRFVITMLGQRAGQDEAALDAMIEMARSEEDPQMKRQMIIHLTQVNSPKVADLLSELIGTN